MLTILEEQAAARTACKAYIDHNNTPYRELDKTCGKCMYVCKGRWRFAGMTGASGTTYSVGPLCPVLWKFSPLNPLALT